MIQETTSDTQIQIHILYIFWVNAEVIGRTIFVVKMSNSEKNEAGPSSPDLSDLSSAGSPSDKSKFGSQVKIW